MSSPFISTSNTYAYYDGEAPIVVYNNELIHFDVQKVLLRDFVSFRDSDSVRYMAKEHIEEMRKGLCREIDKKIEECCGFFVDILILVRYNTPIVRIKEDVRNRKIDIETELIFAVKAVT